MAHNTFAQKIVTLKSAEFRTDQNAPNLLRAMHILVNLAQFAITKLVS